MVHPAPILLAATAAAAAAVAAAVAEESIIHIPAPPEPLDPSRFFLFDDNLVGDNDDKSESNAPFLSWYANRGRDLYPNAAFLSSPSSSSSSASFGRGVAVLWSIDESTETIKIAVAARARGWVGFGLAEAGGMKGSDVVVLISSSSSSSESKSESESNAAFNTTEEVAASRSSPPGSGRSSIVYRLVDSHVGDADVAPTPDTSQDWSLLRTPQPEEVDGGFLIFEAERSLDTGDPYDRPVELDAPFQRVIAAWGDDVDAGDGDGDGGGGYGGGPSYHGPDRRVKGSLRFRRPSSDVGGAGAGAGVGDGSYDRTFHSQMSDEAEGYVDVVHDGTYTIPTRETTYRNLCFGLSDLNTGGMPIDKPLHIIGMDAVVDSPKHLHHLVVMGLNSREELGPDERCNDSVFFFGEPVFAWAPGTAPVTLPSQAGLPLGPAIEGGYTFFLVQFHFDNRWRDEDVRDGSGVRIYFTSKLRESDAGIFPMGDPLVQLGGVSVGEGLSRHAFACPGSCSRQWLGTSANDDEEEDEGVTVFREALHMHETGTRIVNEHIRDGKVVRKGSADYWDFLQSGLYEVPQGSFQVRAGDSFRTTCYYDADKSISLASDYDEGSGGGTGNGYGIEKEGGPRTVKFGLGSRDEMCMVYLFYYPRRKGASILTSTCGYEWPLPNCRASYEFADGLDDVGREFGVDRLPPAVEEPVEESGEEEETEEGGEDEEKTDLDKAEEEKESGSGEGDAEPGEPGGIMPEEGSQEGNSGEDPEGSEADPDPSVEQGSSSGESSGGVAAAANGAAGATSTSTFVALSALVGLVGLVL